MTDSDLPIYIITALLPITACMVVFQVSPYHALALRGMLGALAALLYAVLGAADVSLTEALMGTMLSITLYAVAVRSSLVMRLGILKSDREKSDPLFDRFRAVLKQRHMRLELVAYDHPQDLQQALLHKEVHTTCIQPDGKQSYQTITRSQQLYNIFNTELAFPQTTLTHISVPEQPSNSGTTPSHQSLDLGEQEL